LLLKRSEGKISNICPHCNFENPTDEKNCRKCGIFLLNPGDQQSSHTKTLASGSKELSANALFAGRYKILEELGQGGMGIVYLAEDTRLERLVALKFLPEELNRDNEAKKRFVREAQAAAALEHPNICTVHEIDEAEGKAFISMAFVKGQSLQKRIASGPLALKKSIQIAIQVASGLKAAHEKKIIHRDIKPANIMLTDKDQAKVMDFGIAKKDTGDDLTKPETIMGTITYMSPEQAQGKKADHRTDIWSFGIVFYEILTGKTPFKGGHEQATLYSILNEEPEPITDIPIKIPGNST